MSDFRTTTINVTTQMRTEENAGNTSGKWDESAIDKAYEDLLDIVGWILDQITVTGCKPLFLSSSPLSFFLELLESMESELLIQWKIKQENGLETLFARHNEWLNKELRADDGFFSTWNSLRQDVWLAVRNNNCFPEQDSWRKLLVLTVTDSDLMNRCLGPVTRDNLSPVCRLFEQLYAASPHHFALSFLNLIEIGSNCRPDLFPLVELDPFDTGQAKLSVLEDALADSIGAANWEKLPESLINFWQNNSGGIYSSFPAFVVEARADSKVILRGVMPEIWFDFDQLIGIDGNREKLLENTQNFIQKRFAHHVLLWGGRGTGKSSSVLALMNAFVGEGLRLIEIRQKDLELIPALSEKLRSKPESFILFCDDLSFDEDSLDYKHLKTILEGSVVNPAKNVMLIATANRKDLVFRGQLDEQLPEQKQLIDEKRAIDDRFGLKLFYEVPVFKDLQKILYGCADKTGIPYSPAELLNAFNRFAQLNNHDQPSGRTVFQFINEWQQRAQNQS